MQSKRNRAPARWLVVALSGLASAGFLGAIISRPGVADQPSPAAAQADVGAPVEQTRTMPAQSVDTGMSGTQAVSQANAQPVVSTPRFRTRGS